MLQTKPASGLPIAWSHLTDPYLCMAVSHSICWVIRQSGKCSQHHTYLLRAGRELKDTACRYVGPPAAMVQPIKEAAPRASNASIPSSSGAGPQPTQAPQNGSGPASGKKPRGRPKGSKNRVKSPAGPTMAPLPGEQPKFCQVLNQPAVSSRLDLTVRLWLNEPLHSRCCTSDMKLMPSRISEIFLPELARESACPSIKFGIS